MSEDLETFTWGLRHRQRSLNSISESTVGVIADLARDLTQVIIEGGTVFTFGNGGSAAQAEHLAAELVGRYRRDRRALRARALTSDSSTYTAISNDYGLDSVFSRQIEGLADARDLVLGFSTSGSSRNVLNALNQAARMGCRAWLITGDRSTSGEEQLWRSLKLPGETPQIQEHTLMVLHMICESLDFELLSENAPQVPREKLLSINHPEHLQFLSDCEVTWVNGCFDIIHAGHLDLLAKAAAHGLPLVVGVNSDDSVRRLKGPSRPIMSLADRVSALATLSIVDFVLPFDEIDPSNLLSVVRPKIVVKGPEYVLEDLPEMTTLKEIGSQVIFVPEVYSVRTSDIIARIRETTHSSLG